jgi:hypothetical protein
MAIIFNIKLYLFLVPYVSTKATLKRHFMKAYGGLKVDAFLPSALDGVSGQLHVLAALLQEEQEPLPTVQEAG